MSDALFADAPHGDEELKVVLRLWKVDKTYGIGLPWSSLESRGDRAVFAAYLAVAVRNRKIVAPTLHNLEQFALDLIENAPPDDDQQLRDGLRLLGLADAGDQIELLRRFAASEKEPMEHRSYAIQALGDICADDAVTTLREVKHAASERHDPTSIEISGRVDNSLQNWELRKISWCRDSRGGTK